MAYSNLFLRDFRPVFLGILKEKRIRPEQADVRVIDDEESGEGIFEPVGVREVLTQLSEDLNFLTIYTERPAYFYEFTETMYEENGLIVELFSKEALREMQCRSGAGSSARVSSVGTRRRNAARGMSGRRKETKVVLDFEWEGECDSSQISPGSCYIPIHKKPWKRGENLDIMIPIGYNTVIIRGIKESGQRPLRDRFEEAFYGS